MTFGFDLKYCSDSITDPDVFVDIRISCETFSVGIKGMKVFDCLELSKLF